MKIFRLFLFFTVVFLASGCASRLVVKDRAYLPVKLSVSRVSVDKKTFRSSIDKEVFIKFYLSKPAKRADIKLYDLNNRLLNSFQMNNLKQGFNTISWDGKNIKGSVVESDVVTYTITAMNNNETFVYDPSDKTGGVEMHVRDFTLDKTTGEIHYTLPRSGRVRLRLGLKDGGPLLRTVFDWIPQEAGKHVYSWDGMDESKNFHLLKHPRLNVNLTFYTLPDNCIIIEEGRRDIPENMNMPERQTNSKLNENKYFHYSHKPINCHEPDFSVSFPCAKINENGIPVLNGKAPVRIELAPSDKQYMVNKRFEVMFFVDTVFLFEEEEGSSPLTFYFNTQKTPEGEHLVTVNIMSYDDHIGTKTKKVFIGGKK